MKVVSNKNDTKKRKRDESQDSIVESPKKAKVHAQRKFAQGASYNSPAITLIKDKVRPPANVSSPGLMLSAKRPNTEDFLTFLCFRRTSILPPKLDFFKDAFKQQPIPSNCVQKTPTSSPINKNQIPENATKTVTKKNDKNESAKKTQTPVQALRRKYQEQRLAKQNPTNVTKLAQKVKGKNMIRTRSSTLQEEKPKPAKEVTLLNDGKESFSGLRSGLQRTPPTQSKLVKKTKKVVEMKNLRSRFKGNVVNNITRSNPIPEKKAAKNLMREVPIKKNEIIKNVKSLENPGKIKEVKISTKKFEGLSDFSSDDNEPLLAMRKGKPILKGKKIPNGVKDITKTNTMKTRSQISEILPPNSHVAIRPTRKTKEAAALYMEMITKKLVSPEKSGDDDRSSVDSFPELPNAKRNERRETEIKAKAMALKKGSSRENNESLIDGKERGLRSSGTSNRKRELSRRSETSPGKTETPKRLSKENQSKQSSKEETSKRNIRELPKKQQCPKAVVTKKPKEEATKKIAEEPPKKTSKEEMRPRSAREDNTKRSIKDEKKNSKEESIRKEETSKKIVKDGGSKKVVQEDLPKRTAKEDGQRKNLKDEMLRKGSQEEIARKDIGNKIAEDEPPNRIVKDDVPRKAVREDTAKKMEMSLEESTKKPVKEEPGKKSKDETGKKQEDLIKKLTRDDHIKREAVKKSANENSLKKTVSDENSKKSFKDEIVAEDSSKKIHQDPGRKNEILPKIPKDDLTKKDVEKNTISETGKDELTKEVDITKKPDELTKKTLNCPKINREDVLRKQDSLKNEEQLKTSAKDNLQKKDELARITSQVELGKKMGKDEAKKKGQQDDSLTQKDENGKKGPKDDSKKAVDVEGNTALVVPKDESAKKAKVQNESIELKKEEATGKKVKEETEKRDQVDHGKVIEKENMVKKPGKNELKEEPRMTEETESRPSTRQAKRQEEPEVKSKKGLDRSSGQKRPNSLPKKGCNYGSSAPSSSWLPPAGFDSNLVEAPTFYPTEKEFQDPLEFFERIRPAAESFGLCRIVPPSTFKPDCKVSDDMRFTAYNQYVHRMFHRWGPNIKEMMVIKKYLATQSICLKQPPWIGGIEVDLPRLYQSVQNCGGLMKVMEKKKWNQVADMMRIPKAAQDRVTKLDDIYCKYLLPYDTLSHDERQKLFDEVEMDWLKRQESSNDSIGEESEEESYIDECEECIVKGRNMALNQFYRIARNTMNMWFKNQEPSPSEVENEFWRHVSERTNHVCVHSGSIDSSGWGYGFPIAKNNSFSRHPWNLKVLTNNSGSVLRSLGPVMGVTVPTLHVGMVFTAFCWYRDPHGLPWVEYLHTGAPKIWYGISDDNSSVFKDALTKLLPRYIKNKKIWLTSDTAMVPPALLVEQGVSLCHTIQKPGQFILVFPRAFTSSICTGYLVSESVYFAQPSWLTTAEQVFRDIQDCSEPTMFSLEKLLFSIATDTRSSVEVLKQVLPMVWHIKQKEIDGRKTLLNLGLKASERLPIREQGGNKKRKGRWAQDGEGDYECEVCRTNLCVSLVIDSQEEGVLCLPHAIELLTQKRHHLKYCKLMYSYTQEELCELVGKLEQRIESKSQKKIQNKSSK